LHLNMLLILKTSFKEMCWKLCTKKIAKRSEFAWAPHFSLFSHSFFLSLKIFWLSFFEINFNNLKIFKNIKTLLINNMKFCCLNFIIFALNWWIYGNIQVRFLWVRLFLIWQTLVYYNVNFKLFNRTIRPETILVKFLNICE
jgi:hypothetical protein